MDDPRGSADAADADELNRLRQRAYGPDADIAGDVTAQARLSELEAAHRLARALPTGLAGPRAVPSAERAPSAEAPSAETTAAARARPAPTAAPGGTASAPLVQTAVAEQEEAASTTADPVGAHAAAWPRRRFVIIGGVVVAVVLNVAAVAGMAQLLSGGSVPAPAETTPAESPPLPAGQGYGYYVPAPDAVLALRSVGAEADRPNDVHDTLDAFGISPDELRRYEDFQGYNVWSGESSHGLTCVLVAVPVQGLREGLSGEGCSLRGLEATADMPPRNGAGLVRFVLRGDRINVYVHGSGADPNGSEG